jgi:hypothetical protein
VKPTPHRFLGCHTVPIVRQSVPLAGVANAKSPGFVPVNVALGIVSVVPPLSINIDVIYALAVFNRLFPIATGDAYLFVALE